MTAPLHVIQTIGSMAERTGGPARSVRDLSEALAKQGARVTLVAGHDQVKDDALLLPDPALVTTLMVPVGRRFGLPRNDFASVLEKLGCGPGSIVHDNGIWTPRNVAVARAAHRAALPLVISPHGMLAPWALAWHGRRKRLAMWLYQRRLLQDAKGLVANSLLEQHDIATHLPSAKIAMIPNGVPYSPQPPDRSHRDLPQSRTVLFMSRIHPKKNVLGLIEAWSLVAKDTRFANWALRVVGPDELDHRAEAIAAVARLGLTASVRIEESIPEDRKAATFAETDLFILPSFSENFGIVVAEALAHGVPVIATIGTPWELLPIRGCGWHVAPEVSALSACLIEAMALPAEARRTMGAAGHAFVAENFGWNSIAVRMISFYDQLLIPNQMAPNDHI